MCDGHVHGSSAGLVDCATVCLIVVIDVDTHAIHRSCLRHRSIYSIMAGKLCAVRRSRMVSYSERADEERSMF